MSLTLKENESIITECQLQWFHATLTTFRLVITSASSEENFPLRGISGIGIYDDTEGYHAQVKAAKTKSQSQGMLIGGVIGCVFAYLLSSSGQYLLGLGAAAIASIIGYLLASNEPQIQIESILNIMQQGGSRQFRFIKTDADAPAIKYFIEKVNETLT